jgi:hypothetical protein
MGEPRRLDGRWRVAVTTSPDVDTGRQVSLTAHNDGLAISPEGGPGTFAPWGVTAADVDPFNGLITLDLGGGRSLALWPVEGADARQLLDAIRDGRAAEAATGHRRSPYQEMQAGPDRVLVIYHSGDTGDEVAADAYLAAIAADAEIRAADGWTLVSLVALPLRHAGVKAFGVQGSGYTTKAAMGGLYARS